MRKMYFICVLIFVNISYAKFINTSDGVNDARIDIVTSTNNKNIDTNEVLIILKSQSKSQERIAKATETLANVTTATLAISLLCATFVLVFHK